MQDLRNCPRCGKLFVYVSRNLCPDCAEEENKQFEKVRDYLDKHEKAKLEEIHQATGVPVEKILQFLRERRLTATYNLQVDLKCEWCGCSITGGRLCPECAEQLRQGLQPKKPKERQGGKMHIANRYGKS